MDVNYTFQGQEKVCSPQLVYYPEIICENIRLMKEIAGGSERLWPHIKTHKMTEVVKLLLAEGIDKVKCATISEVEMAVRAGAKQIVLAYPLVGPNVSRFLEVFKTVDHAVLYAIADDTEQVKLLASAACGQGLEVPLLMDVDLGQHRTGVSLDKAGSLYQEWSQLPGVRLCGLHCYDGHRHESDETVREREVQKEDTRVEELKAFLKDEGLDCPVVIYGGTPSFPCHVKLTKDYVSPGTCVIQDAGYEEAYRDLPFVPGAAILTRVVSRPSCDTFTLDLGTKAVACDPPIPRVRVVGWENAVTVMQNEEHLVLKAPDDRIGEIPSIGSALFAIPVHICPTTALYAKAAIVRGGKLSGWWTVDARDRI